MSCRSVRGQQLLASVSILGLLSLWPVGGTAQAQEAQTLDTITVTTIGRTAAKPRQGAAPAVAPVPQQQAQPAPAPQQFSAPQEAAIDTLAPISVITQNTINNVSAKRLSDIFYAVPGVSFTDRGDSPANSINVRGLQDFGRVAVVVDGARQNYQVTGHNANGAFFLDPALVGGVEVVRGPTANVYGSGAIGGVVAFRTMDTDDIVKRGERFATEVTGMAGSNADRGLGTAFTAGKPNQNIDYILGGTVRTQGDYKGGDGLTVSNSGNQVGTGLAKVTVRPMDGHEFKFGGLFQENNYNVGQFNRGPVSSTNAALLPNQGTSVFDTAVKNYQANARWKYYRPDDNLFNWDANIYWNRTEQDQTKVSDPFPAPLSAPCFTLPGNAITGCVGSARGYNIDTKGFDVNNTSRFDAFGFRNALTIGGDGFQDDVSTYDTIGNSNVTTPGGVRTVSGAFAQLKSNYSTWLEIVSAVRYDNYQLESGSNSSGGDRLSPKITVGITPVQGFQPYVSYAEGYRAPSITETLLVGPHVAPNASSGIFYCPSGTTPPPGPPVAGLNLFCFLPNLNLRPEVGKNKEVGINLKYNNIFGAGDSFRGKVNAFRNDLEDYIELTNFGKPTVVGPPAPAPVRGTYYPFYQYQNVQSAHIQGFEAETMYDAGAWFLGVSATYLRGYNDVTGNGLPSIPGNKIVTSGGIRLLDRKMTIGGSWSSVASNQNVPSNYVPATSYDLLNLFLTYEPAKDLWVNFTVDNALNRYYRPYAIVRTTPTEVQNDTLWASVPPGIVYKGTVKMRFSAM